MLSREYLIYLCPSLSISSLSLYPSLLSLSFIFIISILSVYIISIFLDLSIHVSVIYLFVSSLSLSISIFLSIYLHPSLSLNPYPSLALIYFYPSVSIHPSLSIFIPLHLYQSIFIYLSFLHFRCFHYKKKFVSLIFSLRSLRQRLKESRQILKTLEDDLKTETKTVEENPAVPVSSKSIKPEPADVKIKTTVPEETTLWSRSRENDRLSEAPCLITCSPGADGQSELDPPAGRRKLNDQTQNLKIKEVKKEGDCRREAPPELETSSEKSAVADQVETNQTSKSVDDETTEEEKEAEPTETNKIALIKHQITRRTSSENEGKSQKRQNSMKPDNAAESNELKRRGAAKEPMRSSRRRGEGGTGGPPSDRRVSNLLTPGNKQLNGYTSEQTAQCFSPTDGDESLPPDWLVKDPSDPSGVQILELETGGHSRTEGRRFVIRTLKIGQI